jgi:hypothetical protein
MEGTMRNTFIPLLLATLLVPVCANGQQGGLDANPDQNPPTFVGIWRGQFDNLPGVDLVITDEGSELHGAVLFYLHQRANTNSPYASAPGLPEPILNLRLKDGALFFQVSHRLAHPPRTLHDAPINFQLKLVAPNRAELINESEGAPVVQMKCSEY